MRLQAPVSCLARHDTARSVPRVGAQPGYKIVPGLKSAPYSTRSVQFWTVIQADNYYLPRASACIMPREAQYPRQRTKTTI